MANSLEKRKYFFIYKTINLINEKYYIGMHSTSNLKDGYLGSGTYLRRSIRKHGKENFKCEILEFCKDREELAKREKELVHEELIKDPLCMNLKPGGKGGAYSKEHIARVALIGGESTRKRLLSDLEFFKKHQQRAAKTFKRLWKEGRLKHYDWTGKKHSEETKLKISKSKKLTTKGEGNSQFGTCWVMREGISKKIKKEELENYLVLGWNKGRRIKKQN